MQQPKLSIIIPVHNEETILAKNVYKIITFTKNFCESYEIIICENGSIDKTFQRAKEIATRCNKIRILSLPRPDIGEAVITGILSAKGEKIVWYSIDLSIDINFLRIAYYLLDRFDIVIASKRGLDHRPLLRRILSVLFNEMVSKVIFNLGILNVESAKAYRRDSILDIVKSLILTSGHMFDVEILLKAKERNLSIIEVPTPVYETRPSKVKIFKLFVDSIKSVWVLRKYSRFFIHRV